MRRSLLPLCIATYTDQQWVSMSESVQGKSLPGQGNREGTAAPREMYCLF